MKNVLGTKLEICNLKPITGFTRNGCCETGPQDIGQHTVCAEVTHEFLQFSKLQGNDLMTPRPEFEFKGLKAGDRWCLCGRRWRRSALQVELREEHVLSNRWIFADRRFPLS